MSKRQMPTEAWSSNTFCLLLMACCFTFSLTGCGKVPTWNELTSDEEKKAGDVAEPPPVHPMDQAGNNASVPAQRQQQAKAELAQRTPGQIMDAFINTRPFERTDAQLIELAGLSEGLDSITEMDLSGSRGVSAAGLQQLAKFPNVTMLNLNGVSIRGAEFAGIAGAKNLEVFTAQKSNFDENSMPFLAGLTNLKHLNVAETMISDQSFAHLKNLKHLEYIDVSKVKALEGRGFDALKTMPLKVINASGTAFGRYGFKWIARNSSLEELNLGSAGVTDDGLKLLKTCKNLKKLSLGFNRLTDVGAKELAPLTALTHLNLRNTGAITDRGLNFFKRMKKLESIDLDGTACSPDGVEALRKLLDYCTIYYRERQWKGDKV